jgi:2-oxoisovalerate dehydrogenase E1 component beta subunit
MAQVSERTAVAEPPAEMNHAGTQQKTLVDAIHDTLLEEMRADERIVILGEDVARRGGVFRVTAGLLEEFGEARVIDTPLAESEIIGSAIGMALNGLIPIPEIQFLDFIYPAMDQILSEAARIRYRSNNDFSCPIVIRAPFGGGVHGALYHSQSTEALFVHTPGLKVVVPATPADGFAPCRHSRRRPRSLPRT